MEEGQTTDLNVALTKDGQSGPIPNVPSYDEGRIKFNNKVLLLTIWWEAPESTMKVSSSVSGTCATLATALKACPLVRCRGPASQPCYRPPG